MLKLSIYLKKWLYSFQMIPCKLIELQGIITMIMLNTIPCNGCVGILGEIR